MGHKEKKKSSRRSQSRSRDRDRDSQKKEKERRWRSESENSSDRSLSRSRSPMKRKHRRKDRDRDRDRRRSPSRSPQREEKKKRRARSSSRSSDDSGDQAPLSSSLPLVVSREEEKKEKELKKSLETAEEKRSRRLAKKEAKERRRKEQMGWDQEYMGYTNVDNPFGDEHLLDTFVWSKKIEKEGKKHLATDELQKQQKLKMRETKVELEKVKKRRLEREKEREERENERDMMMRDKELEYFREWEKQEDSFHLNQAKLRSEIRIKDGRAKPIDLLAKYISAEDDAITVEMHEPYTYLYGLTITDLEDLLEDIRVYLELEEGKNADYWRDIITVTEDELQKLRKLDAANKELADRREGINPAVNAEVGGIFKGKTTNQLRLLEEQIRNKLSGGEGVDVGYWETLLKQLKAHTARTRLRERHQEVLQQKLLKLKREQGLETGPLFPVLNAEMDGGAGGGHSRSSTPTPHASGSAPGPSTSAEDGAAGSGEEEEEALITEADLLEEEEAKANMPPPEEDQYIKGGYSPRLLQPGDLDIDAVIYEEEEDAKKLVVARKQVVLGGRVKLDHETEFEKQAREGMNDDEAQFSVQMTIEPQAFVWSDKYRPRKPRFFNRVHTGFEWNKYNQTHYDIDNPPPKIVQGYKFNIFFPDLIDKTKTPEYTVTPLEDSKDFAVLRFKAGPPYEDIAFKIVNREWEYSYKRGFRCQFQNNIFQLWFHFKRYRYRR